MNKAEDYVLKITAPKNCYTCRHLTTESTDYEMAHNEYWFECGKKGAEDTNRNDDIDRFEKGMKRFKVCYEPMEGMRLGWNKWIKVKFL